MLRRRAARRGGRRLAREARLDQELAEDNPANPAASGFALANCQTNVAEVLALGRDAERRGIVATRRVERESAGHSGPG